MNRTAAAIAGLVAAVSLGLGYLAYQGSQSSSRPDIPGLLWPNPKPLSDFALLDQKNRPFDLDRLKGKWTFLFFGYTHCPDVCPTSLAVLAQVKRLLEESEAGAAEVQYAFVSVDPKRDTLEHLAQYVSHFSEDFLGVTGPEGRLADLTRQLGILYVRNEPADDGGYLVDHTASILLTDPDARLVSVFGIPHDAAAIAGRFTRIRRFLDREMGRG